MTLSGELIKASAGHRLHHGQAEAFRLERDELIRRALKQGLTHAEIARATGLTRGRIGQMAQAINQKKENVK